MSMIIIATYSFSNDKSLLYSHATSDITTQPQIFSQPPLQPTINMSTNANQEISKANTDTNIDVPEGSDTIYNSYTSRPGEIPLPVIPDETPVEQPNDTRTPDSKETLRISLSQSTFPSPTLETRC
jgi:hypothetical protein